MADVSNYYNDTVVNGTDSVDYIYSSGINVKIYGGADDDTIENRGYDVTIEAGDGNDSVWTDVLGSYGSSNYRSATVDGGEGDDTIKVRDHETSLNGGAGNDVISVYGGGWSNNTLQGGKGNDEIYGDTKNVFVYEDGDGDDTIYYAKTGDTVQIATNSGYESIVSGYDLIVNVGSGKMTFKNAAGKSLNIVTEAYTGIDYTEVRQISAQALEDFLATGKGTDTTPVDPLNEFAQQISKSEFYVIRLMGKIFGEMTKYELNDDGTFKLDRNGNKIEDHSVNKTRIDAGYKAILELNDILDSARKIAKGEMTKAEVFNESLKIATKITNFTDQLIIEFAGDPKAGFITPMGSAAVGLVTNVITCFTDGASTGEIKSILTNGSKLLTETLKRLGKNKQIKDTAFGRWLNGKTSGSSQKIKDFVNGALGKDISFYIGTTLNAVVGVYSAITTYLDNNEQYTVDGLPDSVATIDKTIDVVADVVHSFSNVFMSAVTLGIADADTIFKGVHTVASAILWSFQSGLARITGGDPSQVKFQTTDKNFAEIIGDALKNVITGTTDASRIFNDEDHEPIHAVKGDQRITNYGSYCSITSGAGDDMIFNHEGTHSNNVDGGSDDDYIGVYGPSNTVKGGQGADSIALYSDGKTPAGGNMLDGGTGTDFIFVDDSKCTTLPRRSNNTIIGGEGNDLIGIENTKIPVVIRYTAGDGKDIVFGYANSQTKCNGVENQTSHGDL